MRWRNSSGQFVGCAACNTCNHGVGLCCCCNSRYLPWSDGVASALRRGREKHFSAKHYSRWSLWVPQSQAQAQVPAQWQLQWHLPAQWPLLWLLQWHLPALRPLLWLLQSPLLWRLQWHLPAQWHLAPALARHLRHPLASGRHRCSHCRALLVRAAASSKPQAAQVWFVSAVRPRQLFADKAVAGSHTLSWFQVSGGALGPAVGRVVLLHIAEHTAWETINCSFRKGGTHC